MNVYLATLVESTGDEIVVAFDLIIVNDTIGRVDAAISSFSDLLSRHNASIIHQETVDSVSKVAGVGQVQPDAPL